jgi:hypothetical protein
MSLVEFTPGYKVAARDRAHTPQGALALRDKLEDLWAARGFFPRYTLVQHPFHHAYRGAHTEVVADPRDFRNGWPTAECPTTPQPGHSHHPDPRLRAPRRAIVRNNTPRVYNNWGTADPVIDPLAHTPTALRKALGRPRSRARALYHHFRTHPGEEFILADLRVLLDLTDNRDDSNHLNVLLSRLVRASLLTRVAKGCYRLTEPVPAALAALDDTAFLAPAPPPRM